MANTTKETSRNQERLIADYLGWGVVSGSGARLHPGDIVGDDWLGECKTHMKLVDKVSFNHSVYQKISSEAMSVMRKPVLFCDDGSQSIRGTYALVSLKYMPEGIGLTNSGDLRSSKSISISKKDLNSQVSYVFRWDGIGDVVIICLEMFKTLVLDGEDLC